MNRQIGLIVTVAAALVLTGCGGSDDMNGGNRTAVNDSKVASDGWDAADACGLLDKATVGAALNDAVTETSLGLISQASGPNAATSECTYRLAGGGTATLMARRSPIADNTDAAMAQTRKATEATVAMFSDKKIEDVPGIGKSAFFVPGINQFNVFLDDDKFVILTIGTAPASSAKATAQELVKKIGG